MHANLQPLSLRPEQQRIFFWCISRYIDSATFFNNMSDATADMPRRNTRFEALRHETDLRLQREQTSGPFSWFNQTQARFTLMAIASSPKDVDFDYGGDHNRGSEGRALTGATDQKLPSNVEYKYSNRDNRKGR